MKLSKKNLFKALAIALPLTLSAAAILPIVVSCSSTTSTSSTTPSTPDIPTPTPPTEPEKPSEPALPDQPDTPTPPTEPEKPSEPALPDQPDTPTPPESNVIDLNKELGLDQNLAIGYFNFSNFFRDKPDETKASVKFKYLENDAIVTKNKSYLFPLEDTKFRLVLNNFQNNFHNYPDTDYSSKGGFKMSSLAIQLSTKYNYEFDLVINNPDIVKFDIDNNERIYIKNALMNLRPESTATPPNNIKILINNIDMSGTVTQRVENPNPSGGVGTEVLFAKYAISKPNGSNWEKDQLSVEITGESNDSDNHHLYLRPFNHKTDILLVTDYLIANVDLTSLPIKDLKIFASDLVDLTIIGDKQQYQLIRDSNIPQNELSYLYKPSNYFLKKLPLTEDEYKKMYDLANLFNGNNTLTDISGSTKYVTKNIKTKKMFVSGNVLVWNFEYYNTKLSTNQDPNSSVWYKYDRVFTYSYSGIRGSQSAFGEKSNKTEDSVNYWVRVNSSQMFLDDWESNKQHLSIEYFNTWLKKTNNIWEENKF